MAKKQRSAKQLKNDKRLGRMAKSRAKSQSSKKSTKVKTMVRRNKSRKKSRASQASSFGLNKVAPILTPIAYGFLRERASDMLAKIPALKSLPATQFTDEAMMLGAMWGLKKLGVAKKGIGASVLRSGKVIELARIGETFANMQEQKKTNVQTDLFSIV